MTTQPITSAEMTTQPLTTQPITSADMTTQPVTSADISTSPVTTRPITSGDISTSAITSSIVITTGKFGSVESSTPSAAGDSANRTAIIAGSVTGGVVALALCGAIFFVLVSKKRYRRRVTDDRVSIPETGHSRDDLIKALESGTSNSNIEFNNTIEEGVSIALAKGASASSSANSVEMKEVPKPIVYSAFKEFGECTEQNPQYRRTMEDEHVVIDKVGNFDEISCV